MIKCLVLGGEGMLGCILVKYLKTLPEFEVVSTTRNEIDFYKEFELINVLMKDFKPNLVVNCIGIIDKFITDGNNEEVKFINSVLPHKLAEICKENKSRLIHISTDCVFSGVEGNYTEESEVSPTSFYGETKAKGEVNDDHNLTIRTSLIGPEIKEPKTGLLEWFLSQNGKSVKGYILAIWSGVTTLELAKQIVDMYKQKVTGLINIVSKPINKFSLLCLIKEVYGLDILIEADGSVKCDRSMRSIRNVKRYVLPHKIMLQELKEFCGGKDV